MKWLSLSSILMSASPIVLIVLLACRFVDKWNIPLFLCSDIPFTLYGHADAAVGIWVGIYCRSCLPSKHLADDTPQYHRDL